MNNDFSKQPYRRVIIPAKDGTFTGLIEEFPGCITQGDSLQEVYQLLDEIAADWIEAAKELGQDIPGPFVLSRTIIQKLPFGVGYGEEA
jgi:antitoxin HicB